jgi:hypothetical protein
METTSPAKKFNTRFGVNEENGYPLSDSNKIKINDTKESSDAHKNTLKEEISVHPISSNIL